MVATWIRYVRGIFTFHDFSGFGIVIAGTAPSSGPLSVDDNANHGLRNAQGVSKYPTNDGVLKEAEALLE